MMLTRTNHTVFTAFTSSITTLTMSYSVLTRTIICRMTHLIISPYAGNIYKSQRWEHENCTLSLYSTWTTAVSESHSTIQMHESNRQQIINVYCAFNSGNHKHSTTLSQYFYQCQYASNHKTTSPPVEPGPKSCSASDRPGIPTD